MVGPPAILRSDLLITLGVAAAEAYDMSTVRHIAVRESRRSRFS